METNAEVECYQRHKNLKAAAQELGMKWQTLYVHLRQLNVPITGDKARYGSDKDRLAAQAELKFAELVPFAVNQNEAKFQSKVDFTVGDFKVDVKAARLAKSHSSYQTKRWAFSVKKQEFCADFIVGFAFDEDLRGYRLFLVPGEMVRHYQSISVSNQGKSKWNQFEIDPAEIADFFQAMLQVAA